MPEGPEVLNIVDDLDFLFNNKIILSSKFEGKYEEDSPEGYDEFINDLPLTIEQVFCKGKMIVFEMKNKHLNGQCKKWWIINSLRMTGNWSLNKDSHTKLHLKFETNICNGIFDYNDLYYSDTRSFGTFEFIKDSNEIKSRINNLAGGFIGKSEYLISFDTFEENIKKCKKSYLVTKLIDQKKIYSGIGNYLLSEILYITGINPRIRCHELTSQNIKDIFNACQDIFQKSYEYGGLSMKDYTNLYGEQGHYKNYLQVYQRKKDPHGNTVHKYKGMHGRTIWYVPGLQLLCKENSDSDDKSESGEGSENSEGESLSTSTNEDDK